MESMSLGTNDRHGHLFRESPYFHPIGDPERQTNRRPDHPGKGNKRARESERHSNREGQRSIFVSRAPSKHEILSDGDGKQDREQKRPNRPRDRDETQPNSPARNSARRRRDVVHRSMKKKKIGRRGHGGDSDNSHCGKNHSVAISPHCRLRHGPQILGYSWRTGEIELSMFCVRFDRKTKRQKMDENSSTKPGASLGKETNIARGSGREKIQTSEKSRLP